MCGEACYGRCPYEFRTKLKQQPNTGNLWSQIESNSNSMRMYEAYRCSE